MRFPVICVLAALLVPVCASSAPAVPTPKIISLHLSETQIHVGDVVRGSVVTTPNVDSVVVHLAVFKMQLPMISAGHFAVAYTVPNIPFFFKGKYRIDVVARTTYGTEDHRSVNITFR